MSPLDVSPVHFLAPPLNSDFHVPLRVGLALNLELLEL